MSLEPAVAVERLSVQFADFLAVKEVSFSVKQGEIFGFLGANGAGKTTTIRVLCGLLNPSFGRVQVGGIPYLKEADGLRIKKKVGYMSQKFTLYNDLSIEENLSFIASLRNLDLKSYRTRRSFILDFISFKEPLSTFVSVLPGGIKQQVALAAALLADPEIIFLDEPTAGVTPVMRARFWDLIRNLKHLGKTVFVTTHYMDEAEQCERIALMKAGQIIALDSPEKLKNTNFLQGLYEFVPRIKTDFAQLEKLRALDIFDFFEPYGQRFHAAFNPKVNTAQLIQTFSKDFIIQKIKPTLEDVFIKCIEGTQ